MLEKYLNDKTKQFETQINSPSSSTADSKYPERYSVLAKRVGGELVFRRAGCYSLSKTIFPFNYQHGLFTIEENKITETFPSAAFSHNSDTFEIEPQSMIFLDTETTGLGGTGAVAFLVGIGKITKKGFEISQYLIPDYSDEAAMLEDIKSEIHDRSTVVSFNGASFDLPVLLDRMIINRVARRHEYAHHLDLLHPARRLFRRRLLDCTLTNLERQLFSFYRNDDIPGYLVPSVYFEWLTLQDLTNMNRVLEHNRLDILSMYFLVRLIADAYQSNGETLEYAEDLYSLSRYYEKRKEPGRIETVFERVKREAKTIAPEAALHYAKIFKRNRKVERSVEIWESMAKDKTAESFWACVELAKYYEHQARDFGSALQYTNLACRCERISSKQLEGIDKRVVRLSRKLKLAGVN